MKWNDLPPSELASWVTTKKLEHPTNSKFDPAVWQAAFDALSAPTDRDRELLVTALHYGHEVASLRHHAIPKVTEGLSRKRLITILAAFANQQYLSILDEMTSKLKKERRSSGVYDPERVQQTFLSNSGGQEMPADDMITFQVDSLPHWLFHILKVEDGVEDSEIEDTASFAARAMKTSSIEHSLRHMWLSSLWNGDKVVERGMELVDASGDRSLAERVDASGDRSLAERWFVWDQRQHMLMGTDSGLDVGQQIANGGRMPSVKPVLSRTVVRMERPQGGHRRFVTGQASGAKPEQRAHVSENAMLEKQYTGLFLDETLPRSPGGSFTCRELSRAWWVLQDLVHVAIADLKKRPAGQTEAGMALTVERNDLASVFKDCLSIDKDRAGAIVDWFTCDPTATSRFFSRSFWSEPLLQETGSERRHILLSPLLSGAPVKRAEAWMEKGGISDSKGVKGKGKPFERHVRERLAKCVDDNPLLNDAAVAAEGLKRKGNSEEIDLLMRVGDTVLVGEVKCFIAPSEPLEKHNHLDNVASATEQAVTKCAWAEANRDAIAGALSITDPLRLAALKMLPVVILNHGIGIGLERNGVPVVDLHYLALLMQASSYNSGMRFERGIGIFPEKTELYKSQADLEQRFAQLLGDPVVMKRFEGTLRWREIPFITSNDRPFFIELPAMKETAAPNPLRDAPFRGKPAMPWDRRR